MDRNRILAPQGQNWLREVCFLVLFTWHFACSTSEGFFLLDVVFCLQTAAVCLGLVYYFASDKPSPQMSGALRCACFKAQVRQVDPEAAANSEARHSDTAIFC